MYNLNFYMNYVRLKNDPAASSKSNACYDCLGAGIAYEMPRITFASDSLLGNTKYRLVVDAWTPGSFVGNAVFDFWVAEPPYGGTCGATSPQGQRSLATLSNDHSHELGP